MAAASIIVTLLISACHVVVGTVFYNVSMLQSDKSALEAMKAAISGDFPLIECSGGGVDWRESPFRCDVSGRVISINLFQKSLVGRIATEIGNLESLIYLSLSMNGLSGSIPSSIGSLTSLKYAWLYTNQLSGSLPSSIGNLTSLQLFDLGTNQLSGSIPSSIGNMTSLQFLYLNTNQLSGSIPSSIGKLKSLQQLHLFQNQLGGSIPPSIGNLTSLKFFNISRNYFTGPIVSINDLPTCGNLTANCLFGSSLPSGCAPENQRNRSDCEVFCNATQVGGPCGGNGICSNTTDGTAFTCACNEGYTNVASIFTCGAISEPLPILPANQSFPNSPPTPTVAEKGGGGKGTNVAVFAGGVVGGIVLVAIIGAIVYFVYLKYKPSKSEGLVTPYIATDS